MNTPNTPTGGTTLLHVLEDLRGAGFGGQLIADSDGTIRCKECDQSTVASQFAVDGYRRLEGASDAADMSLIVWADCPSCGKGGTLILGYGPNASEADVAVLPELALDRADEPGRTPDEFGSVDDGVEP